MVTVADQIAQLQAQIKALRDAQENELRAKSDVISRVKSEIEALLAANAVTLEQCFPKTRKTKTGSGDGRGVVAVKYRSGDNTWTGRGKQPAWVRDALAAGATLESLSVNAVAPTQSLL